MALANVLKEPVDRLEEAVSQLDGDNHAAFRKTVASEVANALIFVKRTSRIDAAAARVFEDCKLAADAAKKKAGDDGVASRKRTAQGSIQSFGSALETAEANSLAQSWDVAW